MKRSSLFSIIAVTAILSSCGTVSSVSSPTRGDQYARMYEEKPVTLLIMPPINNTTNVEAKEYLYTSISRPLSEAGYYVISPMLAMDILKAESAYDAELFVDKPLDAFAKFFGADAVVFCEINSWEKEGFGIRTDLHYFIRSTHTGDTIFERSCNLYLDLEISSGSNNWLVQLVELAVSAVNTVATDQIVAARKANYYIFCDIPRGKYSPSYLQDQNETVDPKNISATVN